MSTNQASFPIAAMARVLGVSKAGYYAWHDRPPSAHARADTALLTRVRTIHITSRHLYGAPRVHAELRTAGERHSRKRIARLMRRAGLVGACHRGRGPTTTRRAQEARPAPDLVDRKFTAVRPNQLWVADITFVPTATGFLYLPVALDACSRKIVGWSMANHLRTELVLDALEMAVGQRRRHDVIHHSDQGSQYTSLAFGAGAVRSASGPRWVPSVTPTTTPCARASSRRSSASCSHAGNSRPRPKRRSPASAASKPSTIRSVCTPPSDTCRQSATSNRPPNSQPRPRSLQAPQPSTKAGQSQSQHCHNAWLGDAGKYRQYEERLITSRREDRRKATASRLRDDRISGGSLIVLSQSSSRMGNPLRHSG